MKMSRRRLRQLLGDSVVVVGLCIFVIWTQAPLVWMILSSFLFQRALITKPPNLSAESFTLKNFQKVFEASDTLISAFTNSAIIAGGTTLIALAIGSAAAYALARLQIPAGNSIALMVLATQMFPGIVIIIPLFIVLTRFQLIDTHLGMIAVHLSFVLPIVIWILKEFYKRLRAM